MKQPPQCTWATGLYLHSLHGSEDHHQSLSGQSNSSQWALRRQLNAAYVIPSNNFKGHAIPMPHLRFAATAHALLSSANSSNTEGRAFLPIQKVGANKYHQGLISLKLKGCLVSCHPPKLLHNHQSKPVKLSTLRTASTYTPPIVPVFIYEERLQQSDSLLSFEAEVYQLLWWFLWVSSSGFVSSLERLLYHTFGGETTALLPITFLFQSSDLQPAVSSPEQSTLQMHSCGFSCKCKKQQFKTRFPSAIFLSQQRNKQSKFNRKAEVWRKLRTAECSPAAQ